MKLNKLFIPSLILNAILMALAVYPLAKPRRPSEARIDISPSVEKTQSPAPEETAHTSAQFMNWRQVESADYQTYIANLRNLSCPERTVRAIIMASIAHRYDEKASQMRAQKNSQEALNSLGQEATALIESLFGPLTAAQDSAQSPAGAGVETSGAAIEPEQIVMPFAFLNPDPKLKLSEEELAGLASLRKEFSAAIGAGNLNPADPEYLRRWQEAQPEMDARFRTWFGNDAANRLENQQATSQASQ